MYVFLSYQTRDLEPATRITEALRRQRPDIDVFLAPRTLTAGAYWLPRLAEAIAKADAMLFLVGQRIGPWQELEYYEAQRLTRQVDRMGRPLILPVIMVDQAPGLPFLDLLHRVFAPDPGHPDAVAAVLAGLAGGVMPQAEPAWKQFNPYKGLPALASADAAFFFGREALTASILDAMRPDRDRVIVLVGASGVGKSSIAQAGVLASLKSQIWPGEAAASWPLELADSRSWLPVTVRPGDAPLKELALALVRLLSDKGYEQDEQANGWVKRFTDGATLGDLLRSVRDELNARTGSDTLRHFVIYVDQAEELYSRAAPTAARLFSRIIADAVTLPGVRILASLRADYYGQLQADAALFPATERLDVPPLADAGLEAIIRLPAERLGARFDAPEMPSRIAAATAGEAGALPLLSYLLSDMWLAMQARNDGVLRFLERPELIDIAAPLRDRAERYRVQHRDQERALRSLFTLRLAHVSREGEPVRRRARRSECTADEWAIAEELSGSEWRLLILSAPDAGFEPVAEVAHEQLLRRWPTLRGWLDAARDFLVWKGEIETDRREWERLPEPDRPSGLLSGRRLTRARQWLDTREADIAADDRAFIAASHAADLEGKRRLTRRTALGVGAVSVGGAVASVFGYRAYQSDQSRIKTEIDRQSERDEMKKFWSQYNRGERRGEGGPEETVRGPADSPSQRGSTSTPTWAVKAVAADRSRYTGAGCVVALVGSGIDVSHPAFRGVTFVRRDFTGTGHADAFGHETHTGGTIFGRTVDGQRFGVAPGVSEVLVAKVFDRTGAGSVSTILSALEWVSTHPRQPDVICVPLGVDFVGIMKGYLRGADSQDIDISRGLRAYLDQLRTYQGFSVLAATIGKGAVVVVPAGNNSQQGLRVPVTSPLAVAPGVVSAGALAQGGSGFEVASFSNAEPNLSAPGVDIPSAATKGSATLTGTSMSCAFVAGVASLWWECLRTRNPGTRVTSRMVTEAMLAAAKADGFAPGVDAAARGAGIAQAPLT